jgi:hypothetical protein
MVWIFATVLLLIFVWALVRFPAFRSVALLAAIGIGIAIFYYQHNQQEREAKALTLIQPQQLAFNNIT